MSAREVTERDLRMPEFRDARPEDMEFRDDGVLVRKDRWMTGFRAIAYAVGHNTRAGFEIDDVVQTVRGLVVLQDALYQKVGDDIWNQLQCPFEERMNLI